MSRYAFLWSNAHQLFYMRGNIDSYLRYDDIPFNIAEHVLQVSHGSTMTCYLDTDDLARHAEEGKQLLDSGFAGRYIAQALEQCARHRRFFSQLKTVSLSDETNEQLLRFWRTLLDHYSHSVAYFRSTQEEPSRALVTAVVQVVSPAELNTLLMSPELDEINKEALAWHSLVKRGFTRAAARAHLEAFPWLFQNVLSYDETIDELEQRSRQLVQRDIECEKKEMAEQQAAILSKHPEICQQVQTLQHLARLRPEVKLVWGSTGFYAALLLVEAARRFSEDLHPLTFFYRHEDVEALLAASRRLTANELTERKRCTTYVIRDGKLHGFVGAEAERVEQEELGAAVDDDAEIRELRGMAARPGTVRGTVHILAVNDPKATRLFRTSFRGGVLVTSMTQPNVVDIAQRATAIVTDEGGMLSHAAIIAREFNIPCVVGTHRATKVLRDGDLVEVNANKGVVRVIKKGE